MNATDKFLLSLRDKQAKRASTALTLDTSNPDAAAENLRVGADLGLPANVVATDPEGFKRQSEQKKLTGTLSTSPKTRAWLQDMTNASLAKDDVETLSWFETAGRETKEFGQRAAAGASSVAESSLRARGQKERSLQSGVEASAPGFVTEAERQAERYRFILERGLGDDGQSPMSDAERELYTERLNAAEQSVTNWRAVHDDGAWMVGSRGQASAELADSIKGWVQDTFGEAPEDDSLWADLAHGVGSFAAFVIPALAPGGIFATAQMGADSARMEAFDRAIEAGADEDEANIAANIAGLVGTSEALPIGAALGRLTEPVRKAFGGVLGKFILDYAKGSVEEGVQEGAMGIAQNLIARFTYDPEQEILTDDVGRQVTVGMILGGIFSGGASLAGSARERSQEKRFDRDMQAAIASGKTADSMAMIDERAAASKLKQRSPERFEDALEAQGLGEFHVPADGLREYFQAKDTFDDETLEAFGIDPDEFRVAEAAGGTVSVSKAAYAARISGTDDAAWFRDNATSDPDEMSVSEAQRFNTEAQEVFQRAMEEVERNRAEELNERTSDVKVYDDVFSQLRAAGRTRDVADHEARVWTAFWRTMGERYGADPLALAQSMGVTIRGPEQQAARSRGDLDIMLNTLRKQGDKALQPKGPGVLDFVRSKGGIRDRGGDVEAMDPPKGLIAESRADIIDRDQQPSMSGMQADKKGIALDDLGRALIEAGYFPEYMGGQNVDADGTVVDEAAIALEALSEALQGRERYRDGDGPDEGLTALSEALSQRGVDLAASNDEIAAALEGEGQLFQPAPSEGSDAFRAWVGGDANVIEGANIAETDFSRPGPYVMKVYHGTTHDFEEFDASYKGQKGGHFGAVNYFTSDASDAGGNYSGMGPDLTQRVERRVEVLIDKLHDQIAEKGRKAVLDSLYRSTGDLTFVSARVADMDNNAAVIAAADALARRELVGGDEKLLEVYVRTEKPFVVDAAGGETPWAEFRDFEALERAAIERVAEDEGLTVEDVEAAREDYEDQIDEARWDIEADEPSALYEAVEAVAMRYELDAQELFGAVAELDMEGARHSDFEKALRNAEPVMYAEDPETGDLIGPHIIADVIRELGFDSIILKHAEAQFANMDIGESTSHVHVFDQHNTNIKSVDNSGAFSRDDPRILYQADAAFASYHEAKAEADRLLDEVKNGGDAKEAFAAFSAAGQKRDDLAKAIAGEDGGIELANRSGLFAAVTKSQAGSDGWRVTYFNDNGFLGHTEHAEKLPAVQQALDEGYTTEAAGALREAMKARTFFQKYESGAKRGSIQLPSGGLTEGQTVINLFEQADLSSFLHESGHFFLEAFSVLATAKDAPQAMRDDLAAIHKFLEVKEGQPLEVEQHEKWARGFEAYLLEGKAPSLELADAFARFKAWLTRIYRSLKGLNVKLTPEVRDVMDRMLATDDEISAMREASQMSPLFTDQTAAGMSDAAWNTYQRMARRAKEQASQKLLEKTMAKVRREREKWWKQERKEVRKEVEQTVTSQREHRLIEMLANQRWIGSDREVPDMRLDRDELVAAFGPGILDELSRSNLGGKRAIYAKGGASVYEIAEFFGFDSPAEMVKILQNTGKRQEAIETETDRIMSDRYGDPLNDGSIEEEAVAAIHSEQQAQTVAAEARHLSGRAGRPTRNLNARVFRQRARMMLGQMRIKDATKPDAFLAAERKAAKRAEDAFAKVARGEASGDALATAAKHKEQQLLNHYLYMEARDLSKLVASRREKMRAYSKKSVREKFGEGKPVIEGGLQALDALKQIDGILEGYDFRVRSGRQVANAASLRNFVDQMVEAGRERDLAIDPRAMEDASRKHYTMLTADEFHGLMDTIDNLDHIGRRWGKLIDAKRNRDLAEIAESLGGKVSERFGTGRAGEQSGAVRNFFNLLFRVDTILADIDREEFGGFYEEFKAPIDEGQAKEQQLNVAMAEATDQIFSVYTSKELAAMQQPRMIPGGNGHLWSKLEVLSLAMNMGNEDGRNRVLERTAAVDRRLTPDQLDATLATLEQRDWEFVQSMLDQVNTYWPELAAVHKRRTGTELKKVEATPIETKYGTFRGGYYPLAYDAERSVGAARDQASEWDKGLSLGRGSAKVSAGMTIARQKSSGGRTVDFDLMVAFKHMRKTIRVIAMSEAVDNAGRILKHAEVEQAFLDAGQKDMRETMNLFLGDIAMGPVFNTDVINRVARSIKNNFTMSKLAFNMKTTALQVTGLAQSAAVVGKKNMLRGMRDYLANPSRAMALIADKSTFMEERKTSFQKDIHDQMSDLQLSTPVASRYNKAKQVLAKAGFWQIQKTQFLVVDVPTWLAAYDAGLRAGASEETAVKRADRLVARSQASGLMADRNALERGTISQNVRQSDFIRLWTTLGSYMVTKMNRAYLEVQEGSQNIRQADGAAQAAAAAINSASNLALLYVAEGLVMGLAYSLMAGDDRDEDEELMAFVLKEAAVSVVGGVPFVSDVANALQGYGGGGVLASALETPANLAIQAAQGENDAAFWRSLSDGIGLMTGLPTTFASRLGLPLVADDETPPAEMLFGRNPLAE